MASATAGDQPPGMVQRLERGNAAFLGYRSHLGLQVQPVADLQCRGTGGEAVNEVLMNRAFDQKPRGRDADLPGVAELVHQEFDIGIFDSRRPHRFRNIWDDPCLLISACTLPTF